MGRDTWKRVWESLATAVVFRLLNITVERPSCVLPTLSLSPETHFLFLYMLGFTEVFSLGLYLRLS